MASAYPPPVNRLLQIGDDGDDRAGTDYLALGLGSEHIPDLVRMLQDDALREADNPEAWAPLHASRALGQPRAEEAIEPLLGMLHRLDDQDDEWLGQESPGIFGQIGPAAIAPLERHAASSENSTTERLGAVSGLPEIAQHYPEARAGVVAALTRLLENYAEPERDPGINGFLITFLADLDAQDAAPLIERAFAAGAVDESIAGDWRDIQIQLGLLAQRSAPRQRWSDPSLDAIGQIQKSVQSLAKAGLAPGPKRKHHRRKK